MCIDNVPLYDLIFWVSVHLVIYSIIIGRFSEAGLLVWISFVIFRARNRERSQRHFRTDFWVGIMLCMTMEVEPRIAKQYKCHHCCSCKNYRGKGMKGGKKVSASFFGWPEDHEFSVEKMRFGASYSKATSYCLLPDTFWLRASKNVFKVGSVKFAKSLSLPSIVKKVRTRK